MALFGLPRRRKKQDGEVSLPPALKWFAVKGFFVIVAIWLAVTLLALWLTGFDSVTTSQWGDTFGIVNSLFAALAFLGIIATILLQSHELEAQREELRLTRAEMAKMAKANRQSAKALNDQVEASYYTAYLRGEDLITSAKAIGSSWQ